MSECARLELMQLKPGIHPAWDSGPRPRHQARLERTIEWAAIGAVLHADEDDAVGRAGHLAPQAQVLASALEIAQGFAWQDLDRFRAARRRERAGLIMEPDQAAAVERAAFAVLRPAPARLTTSAGFLAHRNHLRQ
jgi:hypothetical protein